MTTVALGPLRYEVTGYFPPCLRAYVTEGAPGARPLRVSFDAPPAGCARVHDTAVLATDAGDAVFLPADKDPARMVHGPLAQLVARDLAAHDALLLHASAVRAGEGVALVTGAPSAGKSTFARHDPARAFAGNAVCARRAAGGWSARAMPFASDPDPALDAADEAPIVATVELTRSGAPSLEWITGGAATVIVARACVTPVLADPWRRRRAAAILDLGASVGIASLGATGTRADLELLDRCLHQRARG